MSGTRAAIAARGDGLLRGSRTRSYGSLIRSPVRQRRIEHTIQPGETLPGLALKYGVSMEQIKRANGLYTNDSIFLKKSLSIPVLSDLDDRSNATDLSENDQERSEDNALVQNGQTGSSVTKQEDGERVSDLTPLDFLKRLDDMISRSKEAAVRGCRDGEQRVAAFEAACSSRTSEWRPLTRSQSVFSPSTAPQQEVRVVMPRSVTKLRKKLRDKEDEIFEL